MKTGIFGCGDFLRWQAGSLKNSKIVRVSKVFDPENERAEKYAADLGARAAESAEEIFDDPEIELVLLFVPPWVRQGLFEKAVAAKKHVLMTKPLGSSAEQCDKMLETRDPALRAAVLYGRTGGAEPEALKDLFESGELGKLALYKQDWLHHYPQWNTWALDHDRNGGPFMDAMIHNLNLAAYLMGRPMTAATFFSENHAHQDIMVADTELLKADFAESGSAHLFITWSADLEVFSTAGNDREHIDIFYMTTDQGWRVTLEDGRIIASRRGEKKTWPIEPLPETHFDRFAKCVAEDTELPRDLVDIETAARDVGLIRALEKQPARRVQL